MVEIHSLHPTNLLLQAKYDMTAHFYDWLDFPWELRYRRWRPGLVGDAVGKVLEAGVGTGRNLRYYQPGVEVVGIDLCRGMLKKAFKRAKSAVCGVELIQQDATEMGDISSTQFDWLISTFLCCVMPEELQPMAIRQFARVLKPDGKFRLLEMVYSKQPKLKKRQERFTRFVEKVYGARFDRNTLEHLENSDQLHITNTYFIKDDVYLVIEGRKG